MKRILKWASIYVGAFFGAFFIVHFALDGLSRIFPAIKQAVPLVSSEDVVDSEPLFEPNGLVWHQVDEDIPWSRRDSHSVFLFNGKIWLTGGLNTNVFNEEGKPRYDMGVYFNDVWSSRDGENWELVGDKAEFPRIRSAPVILFKDTLYLFGGWSPEVGYGVGIWKSTDGIYWELAVEHPAWGGREGFQIVAYANKLWLLGGVNYDKQKTFNDVWVSEDGLDWKLVTASAQWSPRWDHGAVSYRGKLYIAGGMDIGEVGFSDVWVSEDGIVWDLLQEDALWGKRQGHALVVYKDLLWLIGGLDAETNSGIGDVWYSEDGRSWHKTILDGKWSGREDHGVLVFNDAIWILGGMNSDWEWNNEVWYSSFVSEGEI